MTAADGSWVITGVPAGTEYATEVNRSPGPTWGGGGTSASYQVTPLVANSIVTVRDDQVDHYMAVTPANGATVPAGPFLMTWAAVPGANVYCITLYDKTSATYLSTTAACGNGSSNPPAYVEIRTTSWTSPALVSGHHYFLSLSAFDRTEFSTDNPKFGSGGSFDFTAR